MVDALCGLWLFALVLTPWGAAGWADSTGTRCFSEGQSIADHALIGQAYVGSTGDVPSHCRRISLVWEIGGTYLQ